MPRARLNKTDNERTNERANASNTLRMTCDLRVHGVRKGDGTENGNFPLPLANTVPNCLSDNIIPNGMEKDTALSDHNALMLTDDFQLVNVHKLPFG